MKVLVVGGGSGGHITPAVAVVREILEKSPLTKVEFWTDKKYYKNVVKITTELGVRWGSSAQTSTRKVPYIRVRKIAAGKFRRYSGWTLAKWFRNWWIVIKDLVVGNIVGFFQFIMGLSQSFWRLLPKSRRPDVIFLKGGFVGLPVGIVAKRLKIPYVIHESDSVPGLANRLLMKGASVIATGWEEENNDEPTKRVFTGIPVASEFKEISKTQQAALKRDFGFNPEQPLVVITGGSQGAENINEAVKQILPELLKTVSVGLIAGRKHYENVIELKRYEEWDKARLKSNFRLWEFNSAMHELLGAADIVISRAGATTIAELAALKKAVILVPFEALPNSHQVRNAEDLAKMKAVVMIKDAEMCKNPDLLLDEVRHLVRAPKERESLAQKLHTEAAPDAAERLATILLDIAAEQTNKSDGAKRGAVRKTTRAEKRARVERLSRTEKMLVSDKKLRKVEKRKARAKERK